MRPASPQSRESVWDYPRPPRVETSGEHVVVRLAGRVLADTRRSLRVLETSHPPERPHPGLGHRHVASEQGRRQELVRVQGRGGLLGCGRGAGDRLVLSRAGARVRGAARAHRLLHPLRAGGDGRRRARRAPAGRFLRRLDHLTGERPVQGCAGHERVVGRPS